MNYEVMDRIHIRDLDLRTVIGVNPEERDIRQNLLLNLTLFTDQRDAAETDDYRKTVCYDEAARAVTELVEASSYELIESLARAVADCLLAREEILACRVCIDKPGVLPNCRSVAVEIFRNK